MENAHLNGPYFNKYCEFSGERFFFFVSHTGWEIDETKENLDDYKKYIIL